MSGPYHVVSEPAAFSNLGVHHQQLFGGPALTYTYSLLPALAIRTDVTYLFGKQPIVNQSGGNELLVHAGLQTVLPVGKVFLVGHIEPGISSFSDVARLYSSSGTREYERVTHFSLQGGVGLRYPLSRRNAIDLDFSRLSIVEGDLRERVSSNVSTFLPGYVEGHLLLALSVAHSFGTLIPSLPTEQPGTGSKGTGREEIVVSWVVQPQVHLENLDLHVDQGFAFSGSHFFKNYLGQ